MISQNFSVENPLPPRAFLEQIMDPLSKAYCFLWDIRSDNNQVEMSWSDISKHYNKNAFRSSIRKLGKVGLINYYESLNGVHIELVSWDEVDRD